MFVTESGSLAGEVWQAPGFDDSGWPASVLPLGMDNGVNYILPVNLKAQMYNQVTTLYARSLLSVPAALANSGESVMLAIDYDDGFVLYINGNEAIRGNAGPGPEEPAYNSTAAANHPASNDSGNGVDRTEFFNLGIASQVFKSGVNVIAVHLLNASASSSDAYVNLSLSIGGVVITDPATEWKYFVGNSEPDENLATSGIESDWIELFNTTDVAINLEGWSLTDDIGNLNRWKFPALEIPAKGYLLVFASGIDQRDPQQFLQAPFKLSSDGEYLGLYDASGAVVSAFFPGFPLQPEGTSYGWDEASSSYQFFSIMTPGRMNADASFAGQVADTVFSHDRGFYDTPFQLEITTATFGATIRYTTDGSTPSMLNGATYTGPILVGTTTLVRAFAYKSDYVPTNVDTHTYIFLDDVIGQDNSPEGFPAMLKNRPGQPDLPADYEMDPEVTQDPLYKDKMKEALLSIPSISLVTDLPNLYDRETGLYMNPLEHGDAWERPVSAELLYPSGKKGFQIDAGLRVQGGHTRDPSRSPKHSFRLAFRSDYGASKLKFPLFPEPDATEEFDTIVLRAHGNQSWTHHNGFRGDNRARAQYVRDQFAKDMQGQSGAPYLHNSYAFLYINGVFWGLYNPTERATGGYGESYFGGDKEDYDALNTGELLDGNLTAWNQLMALVDSDLSVSANYNKVAELLDLKCFTDYMLLNHWGGNEDWDHNNWYAMRNRLGGKFHFYAWDSEFFFETAGANVTGKNTDKNPGGIFYSLLRNAEYKVLLGDRIYANFYNQGILTTKVALKFWEERSTQVYQALIAESARWGDNRRDVNRMTGPYQLYTRDNQWALERNRLLKTVIPVRNAITLNQYRMLGWVPTTPAPGFSSEKGALSSARPLTISSTAAAGSMIYYTTDGSDPRLEGDQISPSAMTYAGPISVSARATIRARVKASTGWSPLHEGDFYPEGDPADLQISEIMYAPLPTATVESKRLEFLEIRNSGLAPISLDGVKISGGIDFIFPAGISLDPEECIVVVSDLAAFWAQGRSARIAGQFTGNLSNKGEEITLGHLTLGTIQQVVYSDWYPWPREAATEGYSLIPISLEERGSAVQSTAWVIGSQPGGTPGTNELILAKWVFHDAFGWVHTETGSVTAGNWLFGSIGYFYVGSDADFGHWIWVPR